MVKENQSTLRQEIADLWELGPLPSPQEVQITKGHGRLERRSLWASEGLMGYTTWPHLAQVCRLERVSTCKGRTRQEVAYALTSLPPGVADPSRLLALWRGHWGIENRLHWVRDVTFDEDRCQIRTGAAPQVMAALRNLVIGLLRLVHVTNVAAALRSYAARPSTAVRLLKTRFRQKH